MDCDVVLHRSDQMGNDGSGRGEGRGREGGGGGRWGGKDGEGGGGYIYIKLYWSGDCLHVQKIISPK